MNGHTVRVLVVEDDGDHAQLIRRALTGHRPPFEVTVVPNGPACLTALAGAPYGVVLLDYGLPGMDGLEVMQRIRQRGPSIPIVMVTGRGDERVAVEAMKAGGIDYIVKTSGYLAALPTVLCKVLKQQELALDNARLYEEAQQRLRESEALLELARALTSTLEYMPLLKTITCAAARACEMDRGAVYLWDDERVVPVMCQFADGHADEALWEAFRDLGGTRVADIPFLERVRRGEPLVVDDLGNDPLVPRAVDVFRGRALLVLPLIRQDSVIGALVLDNPASARPITPAQVRMGTAVASQVALAVENARLYWNAQQALADLKAAQEHIVRGETLRALGELAGGVAHHLNNLLSVIIARVEILTSKAEAEPFKRPLKIVARAAKDGAEVVRRIQEFARVEDVHEPQPVDLNELARQVVEMTRVRWQDAAQAQGVRVDVECQARPIPLVAGHPASLREVITNLVLNAVDALPQGGRVAVRTWEEDGMVALSVTDNGIGMPDAVRRRAAEPFFTTKGLKSTGLGLSVSHGIVQRHGGDLDIDSAEGRGTTVTIRIPRRVGREPRREAPLRESAPASLRVLVIDDEPEVREALAELIESQGHAVAQAGGAREGLKRLECEPAFDLVLTDLGMPEMTGWQLAFAIKHRWPDVVVGLITGWGEEPPRASENRSAVDFVVGKPISLDSLRETFARVRPAQIPSEAPACTGPCE